MKNTSICCFNNITDCTIWDEELLKLMLFCCCLIGAITNLINQEYILENIIDKYNEMNIVNPFL